MRARDLQCLQTTHRQTDRQREGGMHDGRKKEGGDEKGDKEEGDRRKERMYGIFGLL